MSRMSESARAWFNLNQWPHEIEPDGHIRARAEGSLTTWDFVVVPLEDAEQLLFYSIFPTLVPEDRRSAVGELLLRATHGLSLGCFELDFASGVVRFRTGLDLEETDATRVMMNGVVNANLLAMDGYLSAIEAVIAGEDPLAAIQEVESA